MEQVDSSAEQTSNRETQMERLSALAATLLREAEGGGDDMLIDGILKTLEQADIILDDRREVKQHIKELLEGDLDQLREVPPFCLKCKTRRKYLGVLEGGINVATRAQPRDFLTKPTPKSE